MEALILAAGRGSRLGQESRHAPKACLRVGGETLIGRNLRLLRSAGVMRTTVVTGFARSTLIDECGQGDDLRFIYNPFFRTTNTLASAWLGLQHVNRNVLLLNGDTIFSEEILARLVAAEGQLALACDRKRCGEEEVKFRTVGGHVTELSKSIPLELAEGEFLGVSRLAREVLVSFRRAAEALLEDERFDAYYEAAFEEMIKSGCEAPLVDVGAEPWCEIDFPADYERACELFPMSVA